MIVDKSILDNVKIIWLNQKWKQCRANIKKGGNDPMCQGVIHVLLKSPIIHDKNKL